MSGLSPSLFIKEPGRTKNLNILSPQLRKEVKSLKPGDLLEVRVINSQVSLYSKPKAELIGEINEVKTAKKIIFTLNNHGEVLVIFVSLAKGLKAGPLSAQFLIKSSIPVFNDEVLNTDLKPFTRSGVLTAEEEAEGETPQEMEDTGDEKTQKSETDPLAGLTIIHDVASNQSEDYSA